LSCAGFLPILAAMKAAAIRSAKRQLTGLTRLGSPELTLAPRDAGPDPRLVALVQALARQAAREIHAELMQERQTDRS
jgi:hypothetical protein